ncbi:DUF262 domain-containing protein, partial [Enterococcus rotai]|uniref:DUF262 domain-containing protein n=1 Tax=Enterococcus rotai TaxID=118060 RepID=UPI0035C7259D
MEKGTEIKEKQIGELFLDYDIIKNQFNYENNITYLIPSYQRVYKWEEELSEILFEDLILPKTEGYNFGFITVSTIFTNDPKETKYELIDGQQRLSTIFLIILSFRYKLVQLSAGKSELDEIDKFIKNHFPFESNNSSTVNDMESVYNEIKN